MVVQRVKSAYVDINGVRVASVQQGMLLLLGIGQRDMGEDVRWATDKLIGLRMFPDEMGRMSQNIQDVGGEFLVVSQFTLFGHVRKGRRPDFTQAMPAPLAKELYHQFVTDLNNKGVPVSTGEFGADMEVGLVNWGPVTLIIDTKDYVVKS